MTAQNGLETKLPVVPEPPRKVYVDASEEKAQLLFGAKPVVWKGLSDLPQVSWASSLKGTWLVLDLWSGASGLCMVLLQLGVHFYAVAAEQDATAAGVARANMPNIIHVARVEDLSANLVVPFLRRRSCRGIILGGGSPCQGNSSLNADRRGLQDPRSLQAYHVARLADELAALPEMQGLQLLKLLENVASMPGSVKTQYNEWLQGLPVEVDAATCGWVHRRRLYWLVGQKGSVGPGCRPPQDWAWSEVQGRPVLAYVGAKPLPPRFHTTQGFHPMLDPLVILKQRGEGAMYPFTREFFHPTDRCAQATPEAVSRFMQDSRRFPPSAYEDHCLLWKGTEWRQLLPHERCQLMGWPAETVASVKGPGASRRQTQNSIIGNGFHLFTLLALFCMAPQVLGSKLPPQLSCWEELALRERLSGTVWEPGRMAAFPGLLSASKILQMTRLALQDCPVDDTVWQTCEHRLSHCDLPSLQCFSAWCRLRNLPWEELGPDLVRRRDRTAVYAGLSGQRYAAQSSRGLALLLPPGLGKEKHIEASRVLPTPFAPHDWPELDISFVLDSIRVWRGALPRWTQQLRRIVRLVAQAVQPLEDALARWRVPSARQVATTKRPVFLTVMASLIRWPDLAQGQQLLLGYPIVGDIPPSGVFRSVASETCPELSDWLSEAASVVDRLVRSPPGRFAAEILATTQDEIEKGFCSPLQARAVMDSKFGYGRWRPMERFLIKQPDGKLRVIDNCRKTLHNLHTSLHETITTVHLDFIAAVAAQMLRSLEYTLSDEAGSSHQWLRLRVGTDDLPDAYRGLPVLPEHQRFSIVAVHTAEGWRFTELFGLAYGLESAVVSFNRFPQLGVAIARRCCLAVSAAYFDDQLAMEFVADADCSQKGLRLIFTLLGAPPQPKKGFVPMADRHYLGASIHVGDFWPAGMIRFQPKWLTKAKVLLRLEEALVSGTLPADVASKLRGDLMWMFSTCSGFLGKLAGPLLTQKQQHQDPQLTEDQVFTLSLLAQVVLSARPRDLYVGISPSCPMVVYSDASFEHSTLRLGWVIFARETPPCGGTCLVPPELIKGWIPRQQQIYPGEAVCGIVIPYLLPHLFRGQDILWFVDNEAAVCSLIRATSGQEDVHKICQASQALLGILASRCWFEWIDSDSNPADGLSRDGLQDDWTLRQGWSLTEYQFPAALMPDAFPTTFSGLASQAGQFGSGEPDLLSWGFDSG